MRIMRHTGCSGELVFFFPNIRLFLSFRIIRMTMYTHNLLRTLKITVMRKRGKGSNGLYEKIILNTLYVRNYARKKNKIRDAIFRED